jgi:hypothetical protein
VSECPTPDFIIGGAPRSATTWLCHLAERHPAIAMAKPLQPEPKFFLIDELYARGLDYYAANWFQALPQDRLLGEKSTNYLESKRAAARIHRCLPMVRLVFLLRNPVDRAYSNYLWSRRNGFESETFERALALEDERERSLAPALRYARPFAYFSRGFYAEHLIRFFQLFPRHRILVLRTEDIATEPDSVAARFQRFLGAPVLPDLAKGMGLVNTVNPERTTVLPMELRLALEDRYREPNRQLRALLGSDFPIWRVNGG